MTVKVYYGNELYHHGIKGMKWGIRRYQNEDGTLTPEGKMRYLDSDSSTTKRVKRDWNNLTNDEFVRRYSVSKDRYLKRVRKYGDPYMNSPMAKLGKKLNATKYGKRINDRQFNTTRNTIHMAGKAFIKGWIQNIGIGLVTGTAMTAAAATGHVGAVQILGKVGTLAMRGNDVRNIIKAYNDIKTSNEYLRIQKKNNT